MRVIALDTETTGVDLRHGAKPYFVTICDGKQPIHWEWKVNPLTRDPEIPDGDLKEIRTWIDGCDRIVLQNGQFDATAMQQIDHHWKINWPWNKMVDTLIAGHLLGSAFKHDLTSMAMQYVNLSISPREERLREACTKARNLARNKLAGLGWRVAKAGLPDMPSISASKSRAEKGLSDERPWKADAWMLRAICWYAVEQRKDYIPPPINRRARKPPLKPWWWEYQVEWENPLKRHPWWTLLAHYGDGDSQATWLLWQKQERLIKSKGLEKHFEERSKLPRIAQLIASDGVTTSGKNHEELTTKYQEGSDEAEVKLRGLARGKGVDLKLPKSGSSPKLASFVFDVLKAPVIKRSKKTNNPSLDKDTITQLKVQLDKHSSAGYFINVLSGKRSQDTGITYLNGYKRFRRSLRVEKAEQAGEPPSCECCDMPCCGDVCDVCGAHQQLADWYVIHPGLNPTGTVTLRWTSYNPNEQNISKKEDFNLRYVFGPAPGREWWSLDYQNLELRIPAYAANERYLIGLFEKSNDPPYFGSNHLLVCHILHKETFEKCLTCVKCAKEVFTDSRRKDAEYCACHKPNTFLDGRWFKEKYGSTWYKWVKNGNFAVQYGAQPESGTADRAYHVPGGQLKVQAFLSGLANLNRSKIEEARSTGYVRTMPRKSMGGSKGYPIMVSRSKYNDIRPTTPLSYFVQGTACEEMGGSMIGVQGFFDHLNEKKRRRLYWITMQVHDELDLDFPVGKGPEPWKTNLPIIQEVKRIMEIGGEDIGVPTPVSVEYHNSNWAESIKIKI